MARAASINAHNEFGARKIVTINHLAAARFRPTQFDTTSELVDADDWSMSASWNARGLSRSAFLARGDEALSGVTMQAGVTLHVEDPSSLLSAPADTSVAAFDTVPRLSLGDSTGSGTASVTPQSMTVTTDEADYAPGSTATFTAAGINSGSAVAFQVTDLPSGPGANGIVDVYAPFSVTDGGTGDLDAIANGTVVAN